MKFKISAIATALFLAGAAQATTVDLTDNTFSSVDYDFAGPINKFVETASGVDFTFQTTGQFRDVGTWAGGTTGSSGPWALTFGGGAGNATTFTLSVSADVSLTSFVGFDGAFLTGAIFDVTGGSVSSIGNSFTESGFLSTARPG